MKKYSDLPLRWTLKQGGEGDLPSPEYYRATVQRDKTFSNSRAVASGILCLFLTGIVSGVMMVVLMKSKQSNSQTKTIPVFVVPSESATALDPTLSPSTQISSQLTNVFSTSSPVQSPVTNTPTTIKPTILHSSTPTSWPTHLYLNDTQYEDETNSTTLPPLFPINDTLVSGNESETFFPVNVSTLAPTPAVNTTDSPSYINGTESPSFVNATEPPFYMNATEPPFYTNATESPSNINATESSPVIFPFTLSPSPSFVNETTDGTTYHPSPNGTIWPTRAPTNNNVKSDFPSLSPAQIPTQTNSTLDLS